MVKKTLRRLVERMPRPIRERIREKYWRAKSAFLYQRLYKMLRLEYTLQSGLVLKVASKGEWWVYNDIFVSHEYDLPIRKALESRSSAHPFTVLDLGANVGFFSFRVIDLLRQSQLENLTLDMTLVEGSPAIHGELQDRLRLQNLTCANLRVVHGLVGRRTGSGTIQESAIHVKNTIMDALPGGVRVDFVDISRLMKDRPEIDLLKCDIEGAEQLFIENYGDLLPRVKNAVFEFHDEQCDTGKCATTLEQAGFRQQVLRSTPGISIRFFWRN